MKKSKNQTKLVLVAAIVSALVLSTVLLLLFLGRNDSEPVGELEGPPQGTDLELFLGDSDLCFDVALSPPDFDTGSCISFLVETGQLEVFAFSESGNPATVSVHLHHAGEEASFTGGYIKRFFNELEAPDLTFVNEDYTAEYLSDKLVRLSVYQYYEGLVTDRNLVISYLAENYQQVSEAEKREATEARYRLKNREGVRVDYVYDPSNLEVELEVSDDNFVPSGEDALRVSFNVHNPADYPVLMQCTYRVASAHAATGFISKDFHVAQPGDNSFEGGMSASFGIDGDNPDKYSRTVKCLPDWI